MKHLRTFILVLLSVLLPIRGAVAAAMLCPGEQPTVGRVAAAGHAGHDLHAGHDMTAHHTPAHDLTYDDSHDDSHDPTPIHSHNHATGESASDGHATGCQFCAGGGCCVTPLAFAPPSVASPRQTASTVFPALTARVAAFYPDGQDRPPRTI